MNRIMKKASIGSVRRAYKMARPHNLNADVCVGHAGYATAQPAQPAQPPDKGSEAVGRQEGTDASLWRQCIGRPVRVETSSLRCVHVGAGPRRHYSVMETTLSSAGAGRNADGSVRGHEGGDNIPDKAEGNNMKKVLKKSPGRTRGKKTGRVLDNDQTCKRRSVSGELVLHNQVILVGLLDVELNGKTYTVIYAVAVDAEQAARIKRMGAAVKRDPPSFMQRYDTGPAVYAGILRDMTPQEFGIHVTGAPKDTPVLHLKRNGLDMAEMLTIDGDPDKYRVPIHNSYLLVDGDGSFCFIFDIKNFGSFYTKYCTVEQIEDLMRGRLPGAPHVGHKHNRVKGDEKANPAAAQPIPAPRQENAYEAEGVKMTGTSR